MAKISKTFGELNTVNFVMFTNIPDALQKFFRIILISLHSCSQDLVIISTSSTNNRWRIFTNLETFISVNSPSAWTFLRSKLRPSITKMNNNGDMGYPCLNPLSLWKKEVVSPLIKTTIVALDTQLIIHLVVKRPKPVCSNINLKKS